MQGICLSFSCIPPSPLFSRRPYFPFSFSYPFIFINRRDATSWALGLGAGDGKQALLAPTLGLRSWTLVPLLELCQHLSGPQFSSSVFQSRTPPNPPGRTPSGQPSFRARYKFFPNKVNLVAGLCWVHPNSKTETKTLLLPVLLQKWPVLKVLRCLRRLLTLSKRWGGGVFSNLCERLVHSPILAGRPQKHLQGGKEYSRSA